MKSSIRDWIERSESVTTLCFAGSGLVTDGPCLLVGYSISGNVSATVVVQFMDGLNANAPLVFEVSVLAYTSYGQEFHPPMKFSHGVYIYTIGTLRVGTVRFVSLRG